jgi:SET domain-containing protein
MMLVRTKVLPSKIHGLGLFADEFIAKGTIIWRFTPGLDIKLTGKQILSLSKLDQIYIYTYSWKSEKSKLYCIALDNGKYFNHSLHPNTLSEYRDNEEEVITIALKDIQPGEEITDNYSSFEKTIDGDNILDQIAKKYNLKDELDPRLK